MRPQTLGAVGVTVILALIMGGCEPSTLRGACSGLGVCDAEPPVPEQIILICDASPGSGCTPESLEATATELLEHVVGIPESRLQVWVLGEDVASTQPVADVVITAPERSGIRAVRAHHGRQIEDALYTVRRGVQPYFDASPTRRSPILGALGKVGLVTTRLPGEWHVTLVSDGLAFGELGLDFECEPPTDADAFTESLHDSGTLTANSLADASVEFAYLKLDTIDGNRCPVEVGRARNLRSLWTTVLRASGAQAVTFEAGPPSQETLSEAHASPVEGGAQ